MKIIELVEMAAPRKSDLAKKYYHGFSSDKPLKGIIAHGLQAPDLTDKKGNLKPVEGKVYITPNIQKVSEKVDICFRR